MMDSLKNKHVVSLMQDVKGIIWIGTREGIYKFNKTENEFRSCSENGNPFARLKGKYILTIYQDKENVIWIGTFDDGLYQFNTEKNELKKFNQLDESIRIVYSVAESGDEVLIGTYDKGLYIYNRNSKSIRWLDPLVYKYSGNIFRMIKQTGGKFILATQHGVYGFDLSTLEFKTLWKKREIPRTVMIDKSGCLWIATDGFGVFKYTLDKNKFSTIKKKEFTKGGLSFSSVRAILIDRKRRLWTGGHSALNISQSVKKISFSALNEFNGFNVYTIAEDPLKDDIYWVGTEGAGLLKYDYKRRKISFPLNKLFEEKKLKHFTEVYKILSAKNGKIYFGTDQSRLEYNNTNNTYREFLHKSNDNNSVVNRKIKALFEDFDGNIWIGSDRDGISVMDTKTNTFRNYRSMNRNSSQRKQSQLFSTG